MDHFENYSNKSEYHNTFIISKNLRPNKYVGMYYWNNFKYEPSMNSPGKQ